MSALYFMDVCKRSKNNTVTINNSFQMSIFLSHKKKVKNAWIN